MINNEFDKDGYDIYHFNRNRINKYTGTIYDEEGYDRDAYDKDGYDRDGYHKDGYNKNGYDEGGYNRDGYDKEGYDRNGYHKDGYNRNGYDKEGHDRNGYTENDMKLILAHDRYLKKIGMYVDGVENLSNQKPSDKIRHTHCWYCKSNIDDESYCTCKICGGIICSCGACLCGYNNTTL